MNLNDPKVILIVDDHQIVREGVRSVLDALRPSWTVSEAANGAQAAEIVNGKSPDLAVIDVTMPDESGLELTFRLRASGFDRPVLIFTMHQSQRLDSDVKEAGAQGYVLKSQATEDLIRAIDILLAGGTFFGGNPAPDIPLADPSLGNLNYFSGLARDFSEPAAHCNLRKA